MVRVSLDEKRSQIDFSAHIFRFDTWVSGLRISGFGCWGVGGVGLKVWRVAGSGPSVQKKRCSQAILMPTSSGLNLEFRA